MTDREKFTQDVIVGLCANAEFYVDTYSGNGYESKFAKSVVKTAKMVVDEFYKMEGGAA